MQPLQAGPLKDFTGYTRIGYPPTDGPLDAKAVKAAAAAKEKSIGLTIYFMVLDRKTGKTVAGDDTFGVGTKGFDMSFVPGKNNDRTTLDTKARYLYLYQVVNDSGRPTDIRTASIRLVVDPRLITSWGYFAEKAKGKEVRGIGFTHSTTEKGKKVIRAISSENPGVTNKTYRSPAPAVTGFTWGITGISL